MATPRIGYVPMGQMDGRMHHQYLARTDASLAPGFATRDELAASKAREGHWHAGGGPAGQ